MSRSVTLGVLQKLIEVSPEVGAYTVRIIFKTKDGFEQLAIRTSILWWQQTKVGRHNPDFSVAVDAQLPGY